MAFAEIHRWRAVPGEVAALAAGPPEPDLVRWFDGALPELDERQRRIISGGAALAITMLVLTALAGGIVTGQLPGRSAVIEVLRLADPVPERPPGPPVDAQAQAGPLGASPAEAPPAPIPDIAAPPAAPPSILRWSVQPIPRRGATDGRDRGGAGGAGGTGSGAGGVYDPYAGAAPQRRSNEQVSGAPFTRPLPARMAARLAEATRARLAPWNGLLRCTVRFDNGGRVLSADCAHRQGLALPAGLDTRLIGTDAGLAADSAGEWTVDL